MNLKDLVKNSYKELKFRKPYIIAEIGVNHEGSMIKAKEMIDFSKEGGADAAKFQTYKAGKLASKHSPAYWDTTKEPTRSQYELFKKYDMFGEKEYIELASYCDKIGIDFVSTPFDDEAIDFLYPLIPFYKIASADITNFPFLRKIAQKGKPVVLSTGASTKAEINLAVKELEKEGCNDIALLHCILNYPTMDENANLNMIADLKTEFPDKIIGYSDHTIPDPGMISLLSAFLKGAEIVEKHFTFDKSLSGNDHYHAMDVNDLKNFLTNLEKMKKLEGSNSKNYIPTEEISRLNARRSIVANCKIMKGTTLTADLLTCKRPAHGISPVEWDNVIGRVINRDLDDDEILKWEYLF